MGGGQIVLFLCVSVLFASLLVRLFGRQTLGRLACGVFVTFGKREGSTGIIFIFARKLLQLI